MRNLPQFFTLADACQLTGVGERLLLHWLKKGVVRASINPATGKGSRRLFSLQDIAEIKIAWTTWGLGGVAAIPDFIRLVREIEDLESLDDADCLIWNKTDPPRRVRFETRESETELPRAEPALLTIGLGLIVRGLRYEVLNLHALKESKKQHKAWQAGLPDEWEAAQSAETK